MQSLFEDEERTRRWREDIADGACVLRQFALDREMALIEMVRSVVALAPLRRMKTPGGRTMSVAMSSCGDFGWITDARGYRYEASDPRTGKPWPAMPFGLKLLAQEAAFEAGYHGFEPDACLINLYEVGARMSLHQDRNEADLAAPIVSVSLGLSADFQFGGLARRDATTKVVLRSGDVVVWGGASRLNFHGVLPLKAGQHASLEARRVNLTFRKVRQVGNDITPRGGGMSLGS